MPERDEVIALVCSDLHLSLKVPACRAEEDWLAVQAGYLQQIRDRSLSMDVPVVCAGDIFDQWNAPPELITFALEHLPDGMLCVPGQHDLPNHRKDLMHRSGYGVLKEAGKIVDLPGEGHFVSQGKRSFTAHGFGWGDTIEPAARLKREEIHLAVLHRYLWMPGASYEGAPEECQANRLPATIRTYNAAVVGDNHKHFTCDVLGCQVYNSGGFMRRKSDERTYQPSIGEFCQDGRIYIAKLDTSKDRFQDSAKEVGLLPVNMKEFIDGLESLGEQALDFRAAVKDRLRREEIPEAVKQLIEEWIA